ncbi:phage tail protein [Bacillus sp. FJAT-45037]|uniref:phage tail protein n=1 Tax=Bacillus sp. FJAT-45037 TaxID=2011007 RepID=UPI000C24B782|nr:hypothetical protein [Bacillus sp. FJAT-45037]
MSNVIDILVNASDNASDQIKGVSSSVEGMQKAMENASGASKALLGAVAGAGAGLIALGGRAVMQLADIEDINTRLTHSLDNTGLSAVTSTDAIGDYATELQYKTAIEHESIRSAMAQVGALENVNDMFLGGHQTVEDYMDTTADLATFWGSDFESASDKLSRYLEDPAGSFERLQRNNISLTEEQKASIEAMQEQGDMAGAQGALFDILTDKTGGLAEASGQGLGKQLTMAKMAFDDIFQAIMEQLDALDWLTEGVGKVVDVFRDLASSITENGISETLKNLIPKGLEPVLYGVAGAIMVGLVPAFYALLKPILLATASLLPFLAVGALVGLLAYQIIQNWETFAPYFEGVFTFVGTAVEGFKTVFMQSFEQLQAGIAPLWEAVKTLLQSLEPVIIMIGAILGTMLITSMAVFNGVVSALAPLMTAFFNLVDVVVNVVKAVLAVLSGDFQGGMDLWNKATESAIEFFKNIWSAIVNFFTGFVDTFISILGNFGVDVVGGFTEMWNNAKAKTTEGIDAVVSFFSGLPSKAMEFINTLASDLIAKFTGMMSDGKDAVSTGIDNIISTITNFGSTFLDAGKGLLSSFTDGIKDGISGALGAVSEGMSSIRNFLPFSPAKKGALSDLDKSGASFFPTWYEGALKNVRPMARAIGGAMEDLNDELVGGSGGGLGVALDSFGSSRKQTLTIRVEGDVNVKGDSGEEQVKFVAEQTRQQLSDNQAFNGLRQAIRQR